MTRDALERVPEPELMDDAEQAKAYAEGDFEEPDRRFVEGFVERFGVTFEGAIVDLGCGPGNVTLRLAAALPCARVVGVDGAEAMLALARERLARRPELTARVQLVRAVLPALEVLPSSAFHAVVGNSLLHHLHEPDALWALTRRLGAPGAVVYQADLRRPRSLVEVRALVERYAAEAPPVLRRDFEASLRAAFTVEEVRAQLARAGLERLRVEPIGDRHLVVWGRLP